MYHKSVMERLLLLSRDQVTSNKNSALWSDGGGDGIYVFFTSWERKKISQKFFLQKFIFPVLLLLLLLANLLHLIQSLRSNWLTVAVHRSAPGILQIKGSAALGAAVTRRGLPVFSDGKQHIARAQLIEYINK